MQFRKLENLDVDQVVDIHINAFEGFFLTELGKKFLTTYYKSVLNSNESISIGAFSSESQMLGFSIGCINSAGFHSRLVKKNILEFIFTGLNVLFTKPSALLRLYKNMEKNANEKDNGDYCELLSIAVNKAEKSSGVGKALIKEFEIETRKQGGTRIALTTDYEENDHVLAFYKRTGYELFYEFIAYPNRKMYKLLKILD